MPARTKEPAWFWRIFAAGASLCLLLPVVLLPLEIGLDAARPLQLALVAFAAGWWLWARPTSAALLEAPLPAWAEPLLAVSGLAFFLACQVTMFAGLRVNGVDFSIFDWMIHSAHQGRGMFSPIYGVNHLGVHQTWPMYLWVPLHALVDTPWWLVLSNALVLWAGLFPLRALAGALKVPAPLTLLASFAWLTNPWLGHVLDGGFRPECLYPVAGLYLAYAWVSEKRLHLVLAVALYLSVKEDAALHLFGLSLGALLFARARWKEALAVGAGAAAVFVLNLAVVQPALLAPYGIRQPTYVSFWGQYGSTLGGIAVSMLTSPVRVLTDIAASSWFKFFLPALGLPLLARVPAAAMAPVLFLLGTSGNEAMHEYRAYYPLPLLAFALWGLFEVAAREQPRWRTLSAVALVMFPLFGAGYARLERPQSHSAELARVRERVEAHAGLVCTQTILFPQLGYRARLVELSEDCMKDAGSLTVLAPELAPWPFKKEQLAEWVAAAEAEHRAERLEGGIVLLKPVPSGNVAADGEAGRHDEQ